MISMRDQLSRMAPSWMKEAARRTATRVACQLGAISGVETLGAHLRAVLDKQRIDTVLDVGAHVGQYGRFLRNLGFRGRIVSFEPVRENFERLERLSAGDARWVALRYALGRTDAEAMLNVARTSQFSSFLPTSDFSEREFGAAAEVLRREPVVRRSLDSLVNSGEVLVDGSRTLLKMDTQGYDLEVLAGATASLQAVLAIQSEVSVIPIYVGMPGYLEAIDRMTGLGFNLSGLFTVDRDTELRVIEFDCVMVRRSGDPYP